MKRTTEIVARATSTACPVGISCTYVAFPERSVGAKLYLSEWDRDYAQRLQRAAYVAGVAPKAGRLPFRVEMHGRTYYGYLTEHVTANPHVIDDRGYRTFRDDIREALGPAFKTKMGALRDGLKMAGFTTGDMHAGNYGLTKDGTLVCIDFDECSRYYDSDPDQEYNNEEEREYTL